MSKRFEMRPATEADSPAMLEMMRDTPQQGSIMLTFEREPNYFHAMKVGTSEIDAWVYVDNEQNRLVSVFSIGKRPVYIDGKVQDVRWGSDLRIHPDYQGTRALFRMSKSYGKVMGDDWMQTVILEENLRSMEAISSGRLGFPTYHPAGGFQTNMIASHHPERHKTRSQVRRATADDVAMMQAFFNEHAPKKQFYPHYDFASIGTDDPYYRDIRLDNFFLAFENERLVGMTGVWSQIKFKQTRVNAYSGAMKFLRPFYNLYARLFGAVYLPVEGTVLRPLYLHAIVVEDNRVDLFADLLAEVRRGVDVKSYDALAFGFDVRDPLHKAVKAYKARTLGSRHYLTSRGENPMNKMDAERIIYLETARL